MASLFTQFQKIQTKINKANLTASYRAINKAQGKVKTQFQRLIAQDSGLQSKQIKNRFFQRKASSKSLNAFIGIGVKFGVALSEFKPKEKLVKIGKGKKARKYKGVTVKLPEGRQVVAGGFLFIAKSGKSLVLTRKGQARNPLTQPRYNLNAIASRHQSAMNQLMKKEFDANFKSQLQYEIAKTKA